MSGEGGGGYVTRIGGKRSEYRILIGGWLDEQKERSECGLDDNTKPDLVPL